jgi:hypothetical protein
MIHPYVCHKYAETLFHIGQALYIPEWQCSVLVRDSGVRDAIGVYPITMLSPEADIVGGLTRLKELGLVTLTIVLDYHHISKLKQINKHFMWIKPYKKHYLNYPADDKFKYDSHCRYEVKKAYKYVDVRLLDWKCDGLSWRKIYSFLSKRHQLFGMHLFPQKHHEYLGSSDGIVALGAWKENELVSAHIFATDGNQVYSHLAASSKNGYSCSASYAVNDTALSYFKGAEFINFGGVAGIKDDVNNGLAYFKRSFSNSVTSAYICGAILDVKLYNYLNRLKGTSELINFFPPYRSPIR